MPVDRMIEKARKLLESGKVERLNIGLFNVVGDHRTYIVVESYDGKISWQLSRIREQGQVFPFGGSQFT